MKTKLLYKTLLVAIFFVGSMHGQGCWTAISAGRTHTVAIKEDGTIWSWGSNARGQLGDGTTTNHITPAQIGTDANWSKIACGDYHTIAVKTDGTLWVWGDNGIGQLSGVEGNILSPMQIGTDSNWAEVTTGRQHCTALKTDGTLWAWGFGLNGAIGDGALENRPEPVQIGTATNWSKIYSGYYHTLGIRTDGSLWAWGWNATGELGDGTTDDKLSPIQVGTDTDWVDISAGNAHSVALKSDGTLWGWGFNILGQLGNGNTDDVWIPTQSGTATNWEKVVSGLGHTIGLKTDGTIWTCGLNNTGQLGNGTVDPNAEVPFPNMTQVGTDNDWQYISVGSHFVHCLKDGQIWSWGSNTSGQFGNGTNTSVPFPATYLNCTTLSAQDFAPVAFSVYPNPATDRLNFNTADIDLDEITLTDISGKVVLRQKGSASANVSMVAPGMYIAKATAGGRTMTAKFIKQ